MLRLFIPFWNAGDYLDRCLSSLVSQARTSWTAHVYDDRSTDGSTSIAARFAANDNRIHLVANLVKLWQAGNLWQFSRLKQIANHDVVVQLDGDDWFPDPDVLTRVELVYERQPRLLATYGNFVRFQAGRQTSIGYCQEPCDFGRLRELPWTTSALKTHRMGLLRRVRREDFRQPDGEFLPTVADLAIGYPMLEMAGRRGSLCLTDVNYVYNMDNPHRTPNLQKADQRMLAAVVRSRRPYDLLSDVEVNALLEEFPLDSVFK